MSLLEILSLVVIVLCVITYAFMLYFKVKGNVLGAVSELIALAESTGLTGPEKMAQVVAELSAKVPAVLSKILTPERIENIAQWIFDWMRKYADEYNKAAASVPAGESVPKEIVTEISATAMADLVIELYSLTLDALKEKAANEGIELYGLRTKKEIVTALIQHCMEKA